MTVKLKDSLLSTLQRHQHGEAGRIQVAEIRTRQSPRQDATYFSKQKHRLQYYDLAKNNICANKVIQLLVASSKNPTSSNNNQ